MYIRTYHTYIYIYYTNIYMIYVWIWSDWQCAPGPVLGVTSSTSSSFIGLLEDTRAVPPRLTCTASTDKLHSCQTLFWLLGIWARMVGRYALQRSRESGIKAYPTSLFEPQQRKAADVRFFGGCWRGLLMESRDDQALVAGLSGRSWPADLP